MLSMTLTLDSQSSLSLFLHLITLHLSLGGTFPLSLSLVCSKRDKQLMASSTSTSFPCSSLSLLNDCKQTARICEWTRATARFHSTPLSPPALLCLAEWFAHYQRTHRHIAASRIASSSCVESIVFALWFVKRKSSCLVSLSALLISSSCSAQDIAKSALLVVCHWYEPLQLETTRLERLSQSSCTARHGQQSFNLQLCHAAYE